MKKLITLYFCCILCHFAAFSKIIPVIKSGFSVNMTPNSNFIRAADFDAGSFVEGATCGTPIIFSFDANGLVLQKDIRTCAGPQRVHIYLTNACDPTDQAKVNTYIDMQNNSKLPNIPVCGDNTLFNNQPTLALEPNAAIFPMSIAVNGISIAYAALKSPFLLKWEDNLNTGSQAGGGTITDRHVIVNPPANNPIPLVWKSEILVNCDCIGPKIISFWTKNSLGNASFVTTFMDLQAPPSDNPNQPIAYAYNGLATRLISGQPFNVPMSVYDKGSYSPVNSPLTFSQLNGNLSYKVAVLYGAESIKLLVKDAQNNKNIVGTYLDIQKETLIKGAFSLQSSNTVATYNMTDVSRTYNWQLDGNVVGTNINTYKTPSNLTVGKHILKATFGTTPQSYDETEIIITVVGSVSTADQKAAEVSIYPNPIVDYLEVQTNYDGSYIAEFSDIMGRIVQQNVINGTASQLDCTTLKSGVYVLKLSKGKEIIALKKVVKK